ncbi:MAG: DUF3800 domain-containing protein [Blastocatellia bacterium]|nr:DUF3800 domain-containing protein [Blastocatellia bacterium]
MEEIKLNNVESESSSDDDNKAKTERGRQRVLSHLAAGKITNLPDQVAHILNHFPGTRNSDKKLAIQLIKLFYPGYIDQQGKVSIDALEELPKLYDMQRHRAKIQNDYGLFLADPDVHAFRKKLSQKARETLVSEGRIASNLRIFADESGKSGKNDKFIIIGSIWIYGKKDWEFLEHRFRDWRYARDSKREFHFNKISQHEVAKEALSFFREALFQSQLTSFITLAIERLGIPQGRMSSAVYEAFAELVISGIQAEFNARRITPPVSLQVHKDADPDTDVLEVTKMERRIEEGIQAVFSNQEARLEKVGSLDSAGFDLIQVADIFTSSVNRWINIGVPNPDGNAKDYLAHEIGNLMGFELSNGKLITSGDFCKIIYPSEQLRTVNVQ